MKENPSSPMLLVGRFTAAGALGGMLVGTLEGIYRYRYPSPAVLLKPGVSYVILFLGPLLDALATGFLGLIAGLFVASRSSRLWRRVALILGVCLVAMLAYALASHPTDVQDLLLGGSPNPHKLALRSGVLLVGLAGGIVGWRLPVRTLRAPLAAAFALLLMGVGIYAINPAMHRTNVLAPPIGLRSEPNIILITLDTVRADHLSLYGYGRPTTPNIDKWGRRGVVFENAIAPTSWTLASHASIFTGLLPHQHGADFAEPIDPNWWTIGDVLSSRGYETAGFTSNLGYGGVGWGMGKGFEFYDDDSTSIRCNLKSLFLGSKLLQYLYEHYVLHDQLDRRDAGEINRDVLHWFNHRSPRPFYLFINYYDVHDPYLVPPYPASRFGPVFPWLFDRIKSGIRMRGSQRNLLADDGESLISYDNCLAYLDNAVGELLDSLSRLPGWENTIVIITSDHGEAFAEHGTYGHVSNLYREVLHVPLIIAGPAIPAGLRVSHLVAIQGLFETVLQLSGMDNPLFQRASLQRFWTTGFQAAGSDEFVVSELTPNVKYPTSISLTTSEWQYLHDTQGNEDLYHWVSDPGEKFNLAKSPEYRDVLKDLQIRLRETVAESLRPWRRPEYLSALGGSNRTLASGARLRPETDASPALPAPVPIGSSQAFFPRRAFASTQHPPSSDQELLRSLPYH